MAKQIKAEDFGTGRILYFSPEYRYGTVPKHMHAPPNFTDQDAFTTYRYLRDAPVGSVVFIEWCADRFYVQDERTLEYVPGSTVWRKSKILAHVDVPD